MSDFKATEAQFKPEPKKSVQKMQSVLHLHNIHLLC